MTMLTSKRPNDLASWLSLFALVFGHLAVIHFAIGLFWTLRYAIAVPDLWLQLLIFSLPYVAIAGIFVASVVFGYLGRERRSILTFLFGLGVSVAACVYDFKNHRYQISGTGHGPGYIIWWWYYEPYWHGYKPGNI